MADKNMAIKDALCQVLNEHGTQLLKKPNRLTAILRDYVPGQSKELNLLMIALRGGVGDILLGAVQQSAEEQQRSMKRCQQLLEDSFISESGACLAVETIAAAVGIHEKCTVMAKPVVFNNAEEAYQTGLQYQTANGVKQNDQRTASGFLRAAEQGDTAAQYQLGECYYYGRGVDEDEPQAVKWYRKAAEQGQPDAQYRLGYCCYYGRGVERDEPQAVQWFRKAAEQGHQDAQWRLGGCYQYGIGVRQDDYSAKYWYQRAAEQGDEAAKHELEKYNRRK